MTLWSRLRDVFEPDPPESGTVNLDVSAAQLRQQVELRQIGNLKHRSSAAIATQFLFSTIFVLIAWQWVGGWILAFWWAFSLMHTLACLKSVDDFFNDSNPGKNIKFWKDRTLQLTIVSGLTFGVAGFYFLMPGNPPEQILLVTLIVGMSFGSLPLYATWLPALWAYIPTALLPMLFKLVLIYDPTTISAFLWMFVLLLIMFYFGNRLNSIYTQAIYRSFEREYLMEQLVQQRQNADYIREASEMAIADRTRFFAAANHDLRQPLQAMGIFISLLESQVDSKTKPLVENLSKACSAVSTLVDQIMMISKLDTKSVKINLTQFTLVEMFSELENEFLPLAQSKGLTLEVKTEGITIHSDQLLLERVLRNLLGNAVRYTEKGSVILRAKKSRRNTVVISVADTGQGISEADKKRLFDEYYRGQGGQRVKEGFGLGLSIVKKISALLNLSLTFHSRENFGTVFKIELPLAGESEQVALLNKPTNTRTIISLEGRRILLLEDDSLIRQSVQTLLEGWGAEVVSSEYYDSKLAASLIVGKPIDCIFSDFNLGPHHLSGLQAIFRIRSAVGRKIPAVLSTASNRQVILAQYEEETEGLDFSDTAVNLMELPTIIQKPVSPQEINRAISKLLNLKAV